MRDANPTDSKHFLTMFCIVAVICLGFMACGGGDSSQPGETATDSPSQKADQPAAEKSAQSRTSSAKAPAGWQTAQIDDWNISFPADWNAIPDTDIWQPGEVGPFMGRPDLSFFSGGIPVPPPGTFDERVKTHIGGEPQESSKVSIAGFSGIKCSWEQMGKKHRGIFLEEKVGGAMIVIHFFDCQAPADNFDQYQADFEKILDSVNR